MRYLILAALGALAISGAASAQQPQQYYPAPQYPAAAPAASAATPLQPVSGTTVIRGGAGCNNCGTPAVGPATRGYTMSAITGGNCQLGATSCNGGCGSLRSDLGFHFGSCKNFFAPCGVTPFAAPWGQGFGCPRAYDSYANH